MNLCVFKLAVQLCAQMRLLVHVLSFFSLKLRLICICRLNINVKPHSLAH